MATSSALDELNCVYVGKCPDFEVNFASGFLVLFNFFPVITSFATLAMSFYEFDVYLYFLTFLGLNFNWGLNLLLQYIIKQSPKYVGCGPLYNMPDFGAQQAFFFATALLLFSVSFGYRMSVFTLGTVLYFFAIAVYARFYIGIATVLQVVVGTIVGIVSAAFFHYVICVYLTKHVDWLLGTKLMRLLNVQRGIFVVQRCDSVT